MNCPKCGMLQSWDMQNGRIEFFCWPCLMKEKEQEIDRLLGLLKEVEEIPRQATIIKDATTITTYCSNCERAAAIAKRARDK